MSEAAKAAQKAKDASVAARAKASAEALLSGDGLLVTSVLSNCFSDPKYGIRKQEEIHHDAARIEGGEGGDDKKSDHGVQTRDLTQAYIYFDGDTFFRLNLTAPYWGTVSEHSRVPPPHAYPEGRSDAVDWAIFLLILMGTMFGFLVMVHQVGIVIDKRLRFRYFFHPTMTESDWASDDEWGMGGEKSPLKQGGGFAHSELRMMVESIPASMGGEDRTASPPPVKYRDSPESSSLTIGSPSDRGLDLEMAQLHNNTGEAKTPSPPKVTFGNSPSLRAHAEDCVERPSARSFSKVALPKQSPRTDDDNRKLKINKDHGHLELPLQSDLS